MKHAFVWVIIACLIYGCSARKEVYLPFYNLGYSASRLFPIAMSDSKFACRIWINNGTSVERIISISSDGGSEDVGEICNIPAFKGKVSKIETSPIMPISGMAGFIDKIDSLDLLNYRSQEDTAFSAPMHRPFSLYVVEIKRGHRYNCFKFCTQFPNEENDRSKYTRLQLFILEQFIAGFK